MILIQLIVAYLIEYLNEICIKNYIYYFEQKSRKETFYFDKQEGC